MENNTIGNNSFKEIKNMKIKDINNANKVILRKTLMNGYVVEINKDEQKIYQNGKDCTLECLEMYNSYTIGNALIKHPYKGGMVAMKILKNKADKRCLNFLRSCDCVELL